MKLIPLKPFGVEIQDVDLTAPLSAADLSEIRNAFDEQFLVVVRGQKLSDDDHVRAIANVLPGKTPSSDVEGSEAKFTFVSNTRPDGLFGDTKLAFHSDYAFSTQPDEIISLYGYDVAPGCADTDFASSALAVKTLPSEVLEKLRSLNVINATSDGAYEAQYPQFSLPGRQDLSGIPHEKVIRAKWPALMLHPRTGSLVLFMNEMHSHHFEGLSLAESRNLLSEIFNYLYGEDCIYQHQWANGDLVIWDNYAISHGRRPAPAARGNRTLRRVKIGRHKSAPPLKNLYEFSQRGID